MRFFTKRISGSKLLIIGFVVIILAILSYYVYEILQARRHTAEVIRDLENPEFMKLDLADFSPDQLNILLTVEDPAFYQHKGVDLITPGAGWTTITQGLVKLYYFANFKPGIAKIKQTLIARFALNALAAKDDQLRLFINKVYLGHIDGIPVFGFADACRVYFGKSFDEISRYEYIALVAMIIAPNTVNILKEPAANAERVRRIKRLLDGNCVPNGWSDVWLEGCK